MTTGAPGRNALERFAARLFGGGCFLCRGAVEPAREGEALCAACDADLPRLDAARCPRCALASAAGLPCGRCLAKPPGYDATAAALAYAFPGDVLVRALKFDGALALVPPLAALLDARLRAQPGDAAAADLVVPVPLAAARLRARGFNQALEIARVIAARRRLPLAPEGCRRLRDTPPQADLPWAERARNLRGAFGAGAAVRDRVVAVVDDVMTSGATLEAVARALKAAGAARVVNWVVARTDPPQDR